MGVGRGQDRGAESGRPFDAENLITLTADRTSIPALPASPLCPLSPGRPFSIKNPPPSTENGIEKTENELDLSGYNKKHLQHRGNLHREY